MKKPTPGKHYVEIFAVWAGAAEKNEQIVRSVMDPRCGLAMWLRGIIEPYYLPELSRMYGYERDDFVHDCIIKLHSWARKRMIRLQTKFDDNNLEYFVRKSAKNYSFTQLRRLQQIRFQGFDARTYASAINPIDRPAPNLIGQAGVDFMEAYPLYEAVLRKMRTIIISFRQSLSRGSKIRRLHTAIACYYHRFTRPQELTKYCYIMNTYRQKHTHLHPHLLAYLRRQCPGVPQNVLNSRIRYLRKLFDGFIDRNGYADFMACWF